MRFALVVLVMAALAGCGGGDDASDKDPAKRSATAAKPRDSRPKIDLKAEASAIAARSKIPILCYHQLRAPTGADGPADRPYIMSVARFRSQLDTLQRRGYTTISPDQLLAHRTTGAKLPPKPVLLTFDDAVDDHYRIALPELRKRKMTATFFVMTVVLGNEGYMTRGQVRRLARAGMTIGAHTWDHHRVDEYADGDWKVQVDEPVKTLESIVWQEAALLRLPVRHLVRRRLPAPAQGRHPRRLPARREADRLRRPADDDPPQDRQPGLESRPVGPAVLHEVAVSELALHEDQGTSSRAISTAWACRS